MNSERFILGDPRFLAGGARNAEYIDYNGEPPTIGPEYASVGSEDVAKVMGNGGYTDIAKALKDIGQVVHHSKLGYHARPALNIFLVRGQEPTAGIEIETVARTGVGDSELVEDLQSNWFHFERDGSLPTRGYELITEPLPPYVYRDPHTWSGLQNVLTPWLSSYQHTETGLHVHVGLRQFEDINELPFPLMADRRKLGKYLSLVLYFCVLDRAFVDRVMLRRNTPYCSGTSHHMFQKISDAIRTGNVTAREFVDLVVEAMAADTGSYAKDLKAAIRCYGGLNEAYARTDTDTRFRGEMSACICNSHSGEGSEINAKHPYTVEFRRGKGTIHSLSVHRIVELATLVVRYAASIARKPQRVVDGKIVDVMVTPAAMYKFIAENTTSAALRQLAEKAR